MLLMQALGLTSSATKRWCTFKPSSTLFGLLSYLCIDSVTHEALYAPCKGRVGALAYLSIVSCSFQASHLSLRHVGSTRSLVCAHLEVRKGAELSIGLLWPLSSSRLTSMTAWHIK